MNEEELVEMAMSIPGRCQSEELAYLYRLAIAYCSTDIPMVELGTFQGRTAAILCGAAKQTGSEIITIDNYTQDPAFIRLPKGYPEDPDHGKTPEEYARLTEDNLAKLGFKARVIIGDSAVVPEGLQEIGLLFIDSEHTRERFNAECDAWLPLIVEGGILACHDYKQPVWPLMTQIIDDRIAENEWERLGLIMWLVAFKKRDIGRDKMAEDEPIKKSKKALPELEIKDGMIIGAPGMGIWLTEAGKRRVIPNVRTQIAMGIGMHHVLMLHPEQLEGLPEGEPMPNIGPEKRQ